jgi:Rrf2 family protein
LTDRFSKPDRDLVDQTCYEALTPSQLKKYFDQCIIIDNLSPHYLFGRLSLKYTKATNYALHIMAYMIKQDGGENISLQPLASHMNMSPTYLSKVLTQLVKADLIHSTPGVNGGYSLRKKKEDISFFDVTQAMEGSGALFTCEMSDESECRLQKVMREAEDRMDSYLRDKKLYKVIQDIPVQGTCYK